MRDPSHSQITHTRTICQPPSHREPRNRDAAYSSGHGEISRDAARAAIPLGIAAAVAVASFSKAPQKVLVTMWISFAIVGTAAVIASAKSPRGFP